MIKDPPSEPTRQIKKEKLHTLRKKRKCTKKKENAIELSKDLVNSGRTPPWGQRKPTIGAKRNTEKEKHRHQGAELNPKKRAWLRTFAIKGYQCNGRAIKKA